VVGYGPCMALPTAARPSSPSRPRVVVVTGASSGIGQAAALEAADRGHHLVLAARGRSRLEVVAEACVARGAASVSVVPTDVSDDAAVEALVDHAVEEFGRLDGVLHCAGVVAYGRTEEVPREVFDQVVATNLLGSANVARHALPVLRRQGQGRGDGVLVLVGSVIGHLVVPTMTAYAVSKWGVRSLARQLQVENRDRPGVHVAYVAPGGVDTPIYQQAANVTGAVGQPPPPVAMPEHVGRQLVDQLDRPRRHLQSGLANDVMRLGQAHLPWLYDVLVGPLFGRLGKDRSTPVAPTTGNVLAPVEEGEALRGGWRRA